MNLLLASFLRKERQSSVYVVAHLVWNDREPFRGTSADLVLIALEPLLNVDEVGVKGPLIPRMNHPCDKRQLQQTVEVAPTQQVLV